MLGAQGADCIPWPVPFSDGIALLAAHKGRNVVVLASGDPFWFGAGTVIAGAFTHEDWRALPAPSTFSIAASRLGWALEQTLCLGLHAAPLSRMRPHLASQTRCLILVRDGAAVQTLGQYLVAEGFGDSTLTVMQALGGPREVVTNLTAATVGTQVFHHPVCVGVTVQGAGAALPCASGIPDAFFETDGVMTKRPIRAMTLSALAPVPGEVLWDIGGGSGSIAIEWLLVHPRCDAITIEPRADRVALIRSNADRLGVDRLRVVTGRAPEVLEALPRPDAVFIGGGLGAGLLEVLWNLLPKGTRIVVNAVTLEAEAQLIQCHAIHGGDLLRLDLATAYPLGAKTGWKASYPLVQWSGVI